MSNQIEVQHVYHHNDSDHPTVNVSVEKNSRGYNYSATVIGCKTVAEAIKLLTEVINPASGTYQQPKVKEVKE